MPEFVLEITGTGSAITLEPVGILDQEGARTLLDAVETLVEDCHALLQINLGRVVDVTPAARRILAASDLPVDLAN